MPAAIYQNIALTPSQEARTAFLSYRSSFLAQHSPFRPLIFFTLSSALSPAYGSSFSSSQATSHRTCFDPSNSQFRRLFIHWNRHAFCLSMVMNLNHSVFYV